MWMWCRRPESAAGLNGDYMVDSEQVLWPQPSNGSTGCSANLPRSRDPAAAAPPCRDEASTLEDVALSLGGRPWSKCEPELNPGEVVGPAWAQWPVKNHQLNLVTGH